MDKQLKEILNSLPPRRPRSRLEPYADLIDELRRRDWPFRDIARALGEKCNVKASPSNVHHFVTLRTVKADRRKMEVTGSQAHVTSEGTPVAERSLRTHAAADVRQRIAALKQRRSKALPTTKEFEFDPSEPLRLPKPGKT